MFSPKIQLTKVSTINVNGMMCFQNNRLEVHVLRKADFLYLSVSDQLCHINNLNENKMMCGERKLRKNSEFQMGLEPMAFRTLVGCSNL